MENRHLILDIIFYIYTSILVIGIVSYMTLMNYRHKNRMKKDQAIIDATNIPVCIKNIYDELLARRKSSIMDFCIYQAVNKPLGFSSVVYSIISMLANLQKNICTPMISIFASISSIAFVIAALYLSTDSQIRTHVVIWRKYDREINKIKMEANGYSNWTETQIQKLCNSLVQFIYDLENAKTNDEE